MRRIKFRAWHRSEKRMYSVNGLLWGRNEHDTLAEMFLVDDMDILRHVDGNNTICNNYELMQFTGLYDGDEKEIYEGDIVKYCINDASENAHVGIVVYLSGAFMLDPYGTMHLSTGMYKEVIGNIYEHPHLLK